MKKVTCGDCGFVEFRVIKDDQIIYCRRCVPDQMSADEQPERGRWLFIKAA